MLPPRAFDNQDLFIEPAQETVPTLLLWSKARSPI